MHVIYVFLNVLKYPATRETITPPLLIVFHREGWEMVGMERDIATGRGRDLVEGRKFSNKFQIYLLNALW